MQKKGENVLKSKSFKVEELEHILNLFYFASYYNSRDGGKISYLPIGQFYSFSKFPYAL